MISISFSTPQLILNQLITDLFNTKTYYNDRKTIHPLELDIKIIDKNLAFEYDGDYWHKNNKGPNKKELCEKIGLTLITIKQKSKSRNYEDDIKIDICNNLDIINNILNSKINKNDVLSYKVDYKRIYNFNSITQIKLICSEYDDYRKFSTEKPDILRKIKKIGILLEFTSHMRRRKSRWTEQKIIEEIKKYSTISELIGNNFNVYLYCRKNNPALLNGLKYKEGYENRFS